MQRETQAKDNALGIEEQKKSCDSFASLCKAAEQGDIDAQYELGNCYYNGNGVSEDKAEAVKWYYKAANRGYARAQYSLGNCYYNGYGVHKRYI